MRDDSRKEGYNSAIGSYWWTIHRPDQLRSEFLPELGRTRIPLPFFATPETHNTPRCAARPGGMARSKFAWVFGCFLPAVPFVHGGFELGETQPVNTGLDFSAEALALYPPDELPLYAPWAYDWSRESRALDAVRRSLDVRDEFLDLVTAQDPASFRFAVVDPGDVVGYVRASERDAVAVVGNSSGRRAMARVERLPFPDGLAIDRMNGRPCEIRDGVLQVELAPWECLVLTKRNGRTDRV